MRYSISWRSIACAAGLVAVCAGAGRLLGQGPSGAVSVGASGSVPMGYGPVSNVPMSEVPVQPQAAEHPLAGALRMAQSSLDKINRDIKDYTCTMIKRERIDGKLNDPEYMFVKVRNQPFSVYLYFLRPEGEKGREVIYVEGRNEGKMLAHEGSGLKARFGTVSLVPTSALAMEGNKYPITQIGTKNLVRRLLEVGNQDMKYAECEVQYRKNAKVNDRVCTIIEVTHPVPRRNFLFHKALIYVDDELNVPIRYEAYMWPKAPGGRPELDEEYTYLNMKVNVGLTDADFEPSNPNYHFK
jgi:hypothetical protein